MPVSLRRRTVVDSIFLGFMLFILSFSIGMLIYNWTVLSSIYRLNVEFGFLLLVSIIGIQLWRKER